MKKKKAKQTYIYRKHSNAMVYFDMEFTCCKFEKESATNINININNKNENNQHFEVYSRSKEQLQQHTFKTQI